ncbi:DNA-directed RNA polymerase subunit delta [Lacticaseibacillus casei]|uniref:Probable DNA-directed RNA polymerase subunit delta n=4 Tax=Lacticaseibacillus TaxID=2759736 RepID=A0ABY9L1L2_9LACO|nr:MULTISPECIES: DNA-directed RNA polymerase subunit delta [Lacticaseibacillus]WFB39902.1 DNA-directed RNA polymerase subunit delta [Lacticaseibacillus huelsenbergensis]WLV77647.1 DNA-directed RNA polymerase subunit delta [Lacticaseibacillus sp. NCIMB 15471]WLV80408.1 DNA-directed RNA polymerase subunit delta [Lacticaseibacillus sp. NCIMB 15473]ARY92506.1 DNA-directed RNA polymerase subunit delta [Lacticaseibacillus casei]MDE3283529.1 DNA-directed RNA polymerase subunit delta [Lacticaseibacill
MYRLKLKAFANADKSELSMIEVAHEILEEKGDTMAFVDLANEIQTYLGKSDEEIRERLPQFYTDLNVDGSFISLGDNVWGLRAWYPYDSVDEEVNHPEDEEEVPRRKKRKKVNAFLADVADDDDVIDYNDDDPEDEDLDADNDDDDFDDDDHTGFHDKIGKAAATDDDSDDDPDDGLPDGIEGQLAEFGDNDSDDDDDNDDITADFSGDDDSDDDDSDDDDSDSDKH